MNRFLSVFASLAVFMLVTAGAADAAELTDPALHQECASFTSPTVTTTPGGGVSLSGDTLAVTPSSCLPSLVPVLAR